MSVVAEEAVVDAPAKEIVVEPAVEPEVIEAEVVTDDVADEASQEASADAEDAEEVAADTQDTPEPVTFDAELPVTELIEKGRAEVLERYELPQPIQAYIETLEAKAQVQPLAEFADYGEPEVVKTLLERQSYLTTSRLEDGVPRANTDKFVEGLVATNTEDDRVGQLIHDLLSTKSVKYEGRNRFEEFQIDALALPNDTVSSVVNRYDAVVKAMLFNAIPSTDIPSYIPDHLHEAYSKLSKSSRDELSNLDTTIDYDQELLADKLRDLENIQKGLDGERREVAERQQKAYIDAQSFQQEVWNTERAFYASLRQIVAEDLNNKVKFSDDPKLQSAQVARSVALMTQALDDGIAGESARGALEAIGISFDYPEAQRLLKGIETAATNLVQAKRQIGPDGQPLDPPSLKKAQNEFSAVSKKLTQFAAQVIEQEARFTATGKAEEVKKAAEKIKVPEKARPVAKSTSSAPPARKALEPPSTIKYGTPEWDSWWAQKTIQEQARRAQAYA